MAWMAFFRSIAETIGIESTVEEFLKRFWNSAIVSVCSSILAVGLGVVRPMVCPASIIALVL